MKASTDAWSSRAVSLFEPDRNCMAVVEASRAAPVVDAESYRLARCLPDGSAQRSEHLGAAHRQNAVRDAASHAGF